MDKHAGLAELRELTATPPSSVPCLNPGCASRVTYRRSSRGRQSVFCSGGCRAQYSRQRKALQAKWERIQALRPALAKAGPDVQRSVEAIHEETLWEMARFGIETPEQVPPPPLLYGQAWSDLMRSMLDYMKISGLWNVLAPMPHHEGCDKCWLEYETWLQVARPGHELLPPAKAAKKR